MRPWSSSSWEDGSISSCYSITIDGTYLARHARQRRARIIACVERDIVHPLDLRLLELDEPVQLVPGISLLLLRGHVLPARGQILDGNGVDTLSRFRELWAR